MSPDKQTVDKTNSQTKKHRYTIMHNALLQTPTYR